MVQKAFLAACGTLLMVLAFGSASHTSAPIKLARHPDYHAGKIAFSLDRGRPLHRVHVGGRVQ